MGKVSFDAQEYNLDDESAAALDSAVALDDDMVNVVVHGHEPTLSQMIVAATQDPEIIAYAKNAGAKGVNLSGICCTANEILMRQGIPAPVTSCIKNWQFLPVRHRYLEKRRHRARNLLAPQSRRGASENQWVNGVPPDG
jgi:hypothetical protein